LPDRAWINLLQSLIMHDFQVSEPILNSPYEEPARHWRIYEDQPPELVEARRLPVYYYRFPGKETQSTQREDRGIAVELKLVSIIRAQVKAWVAAGYPGASATTLDLLHYWSREGRPVPLFFAQREAAQTVIFLTERARISSRASIFPWTNRQKRPRRKDCALSSAWPARWPPARARRR